MKKIIPLVCWALLFLTNAARADDVVTVELFTSQGCSSCPPADEYLAELAERSDVVALAYHVDYWDKSITFSGSWRDPFSKPEWGQRQRDYSSLIPGAGNPYTPEMFVDGKYAEVGSKKDAVEKLITKAREKRDAAFEISQKRVDRGSAEVTLKGTLQGQTIELLLARFINTSETAINAGENKGKKIVNRHSVTSLSPIGTWYGGKQAFRFATDDVSRCAILLQDKVSKRIVTAQYCIP